MPKTRILGVDPGSVATGFAVIELEGNRISALDYGVIRPTKGHALARRLVELHRRLTEIVDFYQPHDAAIEEIFTAKNARSALVLGQARGALMVALAERCEVFEYGARAVKKAVVGYGQADKGQVVAMVKMLLALPKAPAQDAADALAIALAHAHSEPLRRRVERLRAVRS